MSVAVTRLVRSNSIDRPAGHADGSGPRLDHVQHSQSADSRAIGHRGLRMVMRYAHLSPAYLSAEVGLLDAPVPPLSTKRATCLEARTTASESRGISKGFRSSGWIRTSNPPV